MTGLPQGWASAEIGKLCDLINGRAFKPSDWTETGLPIVRIQNLNNPEKPFNYFDGEVRERFLIENGDLLFAWSGTPGTSFGAHVWMGGKAVLNQHIFNMKFDADNIDRDFFKSAINQKLNELIAKAHGGAGLQHVTKGRFEETEIPLPPLPEQRRIVRKLDTLSARSTTARTHLTAIEKLVERYRTGVLEAAFRAAWEAGCDTTIGGSLEHAETGLVRSKAEQTADEGHPYIRMNHYDLAGRWNDRDLTYVAATSSEFARYQLRANDLLFNTRNSAELVGKVAIWPEGKDGYLFNNNLLRMRFSADVVPAFAFWQMSSPPFRRYIEGFISATTSVAAIYQRSLMAAPFWVPDPDEQSEIVRRIETAFAKIDRLKAEAAKALKLLGHLDQRIMAKAFAGDLVPQDPTDEPARDLLARIIEARATAPKVKRGRKAKA